MKNKSTHEITSRSSLQHSRANKSCAFYALIGITNMDRQQNLFRVWVKYFFTISPDCTTWPAYGLLAEVHTLKFLPQSGQQRAQHWAWTRRVSGSLFYRSQLIWNNPFKVEQHLDQAELVLPGLVALQLLGSCSQETERKKIQHRWDFVKR